MQAPDTFQPHQMRPAVTKPANSLLVVGASARAAAWSAIHAGFTPFAVDCFADRDLVDRAWAQRIAQYPSEILPAIRQLPSMPWMYTGGLENHPEIVAQLARDRRLLGNGESVLRQVRDPVAVSAAWERMNVCAPKISLRPPHDRQQRWLVKRRNSAAGLGVHWFDPNTRPSNSGVYYQRFVPGTAFSSLYIGNGGEAKLIGIHRQWIGARKLGGSGFLYCGAFTVHRAPVHRENLERLGSRLAAMFSLVGLFGVDWVRHRGEAWPVDINPRYTATCELLERAHQWPLIAWHVEACCGGTLPQPPAPSGKCRIYGKGILYARRATVITDGFASLATQLNRNATWPQVADIPAEGERIDVRHPVVTLFAEGKTTAEVRARIVALAVRIRRELAC